MGSLPVLLFLLICAYSKLQRSWSVNKELKTSLVKSLERVRRMENAEV